ncbi:MAG: hypothetical protein R2838_10300 [Caldilineaceae bacterium]
MAEVPTGVVADRLGHSAVVAALARQFLGEALYIFSSSTSPLPPSPSSPASVFLSGSLDALIYTSLPDRRRTP